MIEQPESGIEAQILDKLREGAVTGADGVFDTDPHLARGIHIAKAILDEHGLAGGAVIAGALFNSIAKLAESIRDKSATENENADTLVSDLVFLTGVMDQSEIGVEVARGVFARLYSRLQTQVAEPENDNAA